MGRWPEEVGTDLAIGSRALFCREPGERCAPKHSP